MKKLYMLFLTIILIVGTASTAGAILMFEGSAEGGIGSAEWELTGDGTPSWELYIYNTSPANLMDDGLVNAPGITGLGFGFDGGGTFTWLLDSTVPLVPADPPLTLRIGGSGSTDDWVEGAGSQDVVLGFNVSTRNGIHGALYNPDALVLDPAQERFGGPPQYFTEALLTITFSEHATLIADSAYVRMQNVGLAGDGSLKLNPVSEPTNPVPEPASMLLLGVGLITLAGFGRKKFFKN